jgi:hypothetical protein
MGNILSVLVSFMAVITSQTTCVSYYLYKVPSRGIYFATVDCRDKQQEINKAQALIANREGSLLLPTQEPEIFSQYYITTIKL